MPNKATCSESPSTWSAPATHPAPGANAGTLNPQQLPILVQTHRGFTAPAYGPENVVIGKRSAPGRAFTLVELLVVMGIIVVLVALIFPAVANARKSSLNARCVSNLQQLGVAMGLWAGDYGCYPAPAADTDGDGVFEPCREWNFCGIGDTQGRPSLFRKLYSAEAIPFIWSGAGLPRGAEIYHLRNTAFVCPSAVAGYGVQTNQAQENYRQRSYGMNCVAAGGGAVVPGWSYPIYPSTLASPSSTFLLMDSAAFLTNIYYATTLEPRRFSNVSARHEGRLNVLYCDLHVGSVSPSSISRSPTDPFWGYQP